MKGPNMTPKEPFIRSYEKCSMHMCRIYFACSDSGMCEFHRSNPLRLEGAGIAELLSSGYSSDVDEFGFTVLLNGSIIAAYSGIPRDCLMNTRNTFIFAKLHLRTAKMYAEIHMSRRMTMNVVEYETAKALANQRGLDAGKLHSALNWFVRDNGDGTAVAAAISGSGWSVRRGKIRWNDQGDPNRFVLSDLYEKAH